MISDERRREFLTSFAEFADAYLSAPRGQEHLRRYQEVRQQGRKNFDDIAAQHQAGAEVPTKDVLLKLLPHTDSAAHRSSGAWIHVAPAIQGDIQIWFEKAGWTRPDDWPKVASAILTLLVKCADNPSSLLSACNEFAALPYTTGFQTGMLTPILNALRPSDFAIINNKSRRVLNYLTSSAFKQRLLDYPAANSAIRELIAEFDKPLRNIDQAVTYAADVFDMYCHWLVAEKKDSPVYAREGRIRAPAGEVVVAVPEDDDIPASTASVDSQARESHRIQALLGDIGAKLRFKIWIPRSDRSNVLQCSPGLASSLLETLPLNYIDAALKTIEQIDVIWIRGLAIGRAFEVEHTTAIYSGLLRMADLISLQPNIDIRLHIVAQDEKHDKVMREIIRPTFRNFERPLHQRCSFLSYSSVTELHGLSHLEFMTDDIVRKYEEFAEEE